jgi:hypothetical protein
MKSFCMFRLAHELLAQRKFEICSVFFTHTCQHTGVRPYEGRKQAKGNIVPAGVWYCVAFFYVLSENQFF